MSDLFAMSPEQERWAFASKIMATHGDDVGVYIADRIRDLAHQSDMDGVKFWVDIADKVTQLAGPDEGAWIQ